MMEYLKATMQVPVAVGLIGWAAIALPAGQAIRETVDEVRDWRALRKRKPCRPRQLGTCVTGEQACHECMLGDGYCRKEACHNPDWRLSACAGLGVPGCRHQSPKEYHDQS